MEKTCCAECGESGDKLFIHSACCNSHWELVLLKDQSYRLECGECGKDSGTEWRKRH